MLSQWWSHIENTITKGCNIVVLSWGYQTCYSKLVQVVNSLVQVHTKLGRRTWNKQCEYNLSWDVNKSLQLVCWVVTTSVFLSLYMDDYCWSLLALLPRSCNIKMGKVCCSIPLLYEQYFWEMLSYRTRPLIGQHNHSASFSA